MDTLYLHIGYGKSGTTAIQKYAFRHFNDQKVFLPKTGWWKEGVGHHHLTNDLDRSIPDSTLIPKWENTISELLQANTKKGFISSEQLCFFEPEQIELIHGIISRGNWAIKIIFFVRNQLDLILSSYLEKLKHNPIQKIGDFNFFLAQNKEYFEFSKRLESWERLFGMDNLIVKLYDKSLYSNIVPVLCEIIDVPYIQSIDHDQTDLMTNLSLIPETISLINIFDQQSLVLLNHLLLRSIYNHLAPFQPP